MSRASRLTLVASCGTSAMLIAFVHWQQWQDRLSMIPSDADAGEEDRLQRWRAVREQLPSSPATK